MFTTPSIPAGDLPELGPVTSKQYLVHIGVLKDEPQDDSITPDQIKDQFRARGMTFSQWARENGYTANRVLRILNGFDKGYYGKGHEIAVKLGLKAGPDSATH